MMEQYQLKEMGLGRILGPLDQCSFKNIQISLFGVIPKSHCLGEWRLIVDLSHPTGASVDDGIKPELCTLRYTSVDEAIKWIHA